MSIATQFANWAHGLTLSHVPSHVVREARRALLDTVGVTCAGACHEVAQKMRLATQMDRGPSSVTGGGKTNAGDAALINGTAAHAYDFDDASHTGIMHGSAIILPAVLAAMEETGATDVQALEAIIVGSEISYVLGDTVTHGHYYRGWWSTGTLSGIGAAAAVALLYGLPPEQIAHAIALAAGSAGGARAVVGTDAKPYLCGHAARSAIEFAGAARAGIDGPG